MWSKNKLKRGMELTSNSYFVHPHLLISRKLNWLKFTRLAAQFSRLT